MKKYVWTACLILLAVYGCSKKDQGCMPVTPAAEEPQMKAYATANGIIADKHSSGMYYQVIDSGMGATPNINSKVYITYTGKLLNGSQFDQATDASTTGWTLGTLIEGWQIGLPLIKKGGRIKLIIPSSLAYGCNGAGGAIPSNAVLFFDITLTDVK